MDLVEFQGKQVFRRNGVPVPPEGAVCRTVDEIEQAARDIMAGAGSSSTLPDEGAGSSSTLPDEGAGSSSTLPDEGAGSSSTLPDETGRADMVVVKAQVKTGGRGKAGGVKLAKSVDEARAHGEAILGLDIKGHEVRVVYVEPASDIAEEYYLSVMHDRVHKGYLVICSREGGVDIEEVNRTDPDAVVKEPILPGEAPDGDLPPERARDIVTRARLPEEIRDEAADLLVKLFRTLVVEDATLVEINPLIRTEDGRVIALDAKVSLDDNAAFRHDDYAEWQIEGIDVDDPLEAEAKQKGIQYVKLDGSVGVLGNGAGLVMATLDVIAQHGGRAADFLDVGGGASADAMAESLGLVLKDPAVTSVFVNIFGGITRGEEVANGIVEATRRLGDFPQKLVVRLDGTNAEEGRRILDEADLPSVVTAPTMDDAAEKAVALARGTSADA